MLVGAAKLADDVSDKNYKMGKEHGEVHFLAIRINLTVFVFRGTDCGQHGNRHGQLNRQRPKDAGEAIDKRVGVNHIRILLLF